MLIVILMSLNSVSADTFLSFYVCIRTVNDLEKELLIDCTIYLFSDIHNAHSYSRCGDSGNALFTLELFR